MAQVRDNNFPLESIHPYALKAGEAAECASEQGKYWEMHDRLFANQQTLSELDLLKHARAIGVEHNRFAECLKGATTARIREDVAEGRRLGVQSTPTFFLGEVQANGQLGYLVDSSRHVGFEFHQGSRPAISFL